MKLFLAIELKTRQFGDVNESIARQWIADLRSDKYKQGQGQLCDGKKHCPLGVLCEQAVEAKAVHRKASAGRVEFDGRAGMLPPNVRAWAEMKAFNLNDQGKSMGPSLRGKYSSESGDKPGPSRDIVDDNDAGKSFAEIADIIEANWEKM